VFDYTQTADGIWHIHSITLSDSNGTNVRKITYSYYGNYDSNGLAGDLKTILTQQWNGTGWTGDDTNYFRYYTSPTAAHELKRVVCGGSGLADSWRGRDNDPPHRSF
jgi:hypothetical protein